MVNLTLLECYNQKRKLQLMKKIEILFLGLFVQLFFGQATRFIYQVSMKPDSTDRTEIKTEFAHLDVAAGNSIFYSENLLKRDSIISKMQATKNFNFDRNQMQGLRSAMNYQVEKNLSTGSKIFKSRILRDEYAYEEDRPMIWKILPETAKIGEYKTQKAETNFAGRTWSAWFTTEIPIQDGPYKFSGLPGLIIKVEDSKGDYSFDLKETKKIAEIPTFNKRGSTIPVKREVFEKQQQQFEKDPMAALNAMGSQNMRIQMDPDQRKQMETRQKTENKKKNNPIEIN